MCLYLNTWYSIMRFKVKAFLYPAFFAAYLNAFTPPFPATPIKKDAPPLPRSAFL